MESLETGSSLVEAMKGQQDKSISGSSKNINSPENSTTRDAAVAQALSQMGLIDSNNSNNKYNKKNIKVFQKVKPADLQRRRRNHEAVQRQKQSNQKAYQDMIAMRSQLPAFKHQDEIVQKVANNQVTIVSGDTGAFLCETLDFFQPFGRLHVVLIICSCCLRLTISCTAHHSKQNNRLRKKYAR